MVLMLSNSRSAVLLALVTCVVGRFSPSSGVDATAASPDIIPDKYIFEASDSSALRQFGDGGSQRRSFYDQQRKRGIDFTVTKIFNSPGLFLGGVLEVADGEDVSALSEIDGLVSLKPVRRYQTLKPASLETLVDTDGSTPADSLSTHVMTGVDKAHAQGLTGEGIKIAIIDSGIDYTHPALGGGFGSGFKVGGGFDLVGDDYDGSNTPMPDPDPLDKCNGRGTHIAGIIGANPGEGRNISGVAYDATIYAYRIFGCGGISDTPVILDAFLRAANDGVDVISLGLGIRDIGFSEDPVGVVASTMAKNGIVVTMPTGNDGAHGPWYALAPATGKDVISVGSVDNTILEGLPNPDPRGVMSSFSSLGPTYELDFKPAISAPGRGIFSTLPNNTYGTIGGTTTASPFIAGAAALILQAKGKTKAVAVAMRDIMESTASPIPSNLTQSALPQTLIQSGAGLIQVYSAANSETLVQPGHLLLNDTAHFREEHQFTITNQRNHPVAYSLTHIPAGTIYTYNGLEPALPPYKLTADSASVKFSESEFSLYPGKTQTITAIFTPPAIDSKGYPAYSGHIQIASLFEITRVSYMGVVGSVHKQQLLDHSDVPFSHPLPVLLRPDGSFQDTTTKYTFVDGDRPKLVSRLLFGCPKLLFDLEKVDSGGSNPTVVGNILTLDFNPRTLPGEFLNLTLSSSFGNGTRIPDGEYRILLSALKIFGEPSNKGDWITHRSRSFIKASTAS